MYINLDYSLWVFQYYYIKFTLVGGEVKNYPQILPEK